MSNFKWQDEAISKRRVLLRGSRASGKTYAAIQWARKAGRRVLFGTPYEAMIQSIMDTMYHMYRDEVVLFQPGRKMIVFNDGTQIDFVSVRNELDFKMHGLRVDAIVLDDIGDMTDDAVVTIAMSAAHIYNFKFFATYSTERKSGVKRLSKLEDVEYVTVDYLDLLENGILSASAVRDIKNYMSPKTFKEEFGPYDYKRTGPLKNVFFKHLLDM
jgi:hypothetical protein